MDIDIGTNISDTPKTCDESSPSVTEGAAPLDDQQLILKYLHLVPIAVNRLKRSVPAHVQADDLYSIGVAGLISAVSRFNPATAETFGSFASIRIRGAMLDELRRTDVCPRRTRVRVREFEAAISSVEQKLGRAVTPADVCATLGWSQREYFKRAREATPIQIVTLDSRPDGESSGPSLYEVVADANDETGREQLEKTELVELLTQQMASLPDIQRKILAMYYFENLRFVEIAAVFDLTESRISQIHQAALQSLRQWIQVAREK